MIPAQEKLLVSLRDFLASDISSAVWGYSTRTLLDFGNLVSDIWGYSTAGIELGAVKTKLGEFQELVTAVGSVGLLFGLSGRTQMLAVGGILIALVVGFIAFAFYMLALKPSWRGKTKKEKKQREGGDSGIFAFVARLKPIIRIPSPPRFAFPRLAFPVVLVLAGFLSATASGLITATALSLKTQLTSQFVLGDTTEVVAVEAEPGGDQLAVGGIDIVRVVVPPESRVNLRSQPDLNASVLAKIEDIREVVRLDESGDWTKVTLEDLKLEGWISTEFIEEGKPNDGSVLGSEVSRSVRILDTPTGWVRVRETPWGTETGRVYPGNRLKFLTEVEGWVQVELPDANRGWVYKEYAQVE